MEDEKKKKRNKKKKNKQQNNNNNNKGTAGESTSIDQEEHVTENGQNTTNGQVSEETRDSETDIMHNMETHLPHGAQGLAQAEKQYWLDREASLEEKIKQLEKENDVYKEKEAILKAKVEHLLREKDIVVQEEASLEEKLKQLQNVKHAYEEKEAILEEKIVQLQKEREAHMQKEASLDEKVRQMQKEKESLMQKEGELDMKITHLQSEKNSWLQKEAGFEEKIDQLVDEAATLSLKGVSLVEKIKQMERERDSWVQNENSRKERIGGLDKDNTKLRAEVMELKELRDSLLQENQLLKDNISGQQSHIQSLEENDAFPNASIGRQMDTSENGVNSEIDAACMLVERLITENAELVEKVNALYVELAPRGPTAGVSSSVGSHSESGAAESAHVAESSPPASKQVIAAAKTRETGHEPEPVLESNTRMSSPGESKESMEEVVIKDERTFGDYLNANNSILYRNSSENTESDKIVQIPLDENEIQVVNSEAAHNEEKTDVPISDAPLIGAPFRLISFVARYVSGADLVDKSALNSGG